ncbi:MAG: hypothetical protein LQ344_008004 [Seirophora lacunosa]|nr:MAG: hypothetical protein LQ344_008004 [Seirophora lacunosa]
MPILERLEDYSIYLGSDGYPVIVTNRDPDRWLLSIEELYSIIEWTSMTVLGPTFPGPDWQCRSQLRAGFLRHYQLIRSPVPSDRLLEFRSKDGREPLCAFLEKAVAAERYPFVNAGNELFHIHYALVAVTAVSLIVKGLVWVAPVTVVLFGVWKYYV